MSTNFYLENKDGSHQYHLGKRSGGMQFLFRASADSGVVNIHSWLKAAKELEKKGYVLTNDNGSDEKNLKDLLKEILALIQAGGKQHKLSSQGWYDDAGHSFYDGEFC